MFMRPRSFLLLLVLLSVAVALHAQHWNPPSDDEKEAIAEHWSRIAWADSTGDALVAVRTRIMLAPLVKASAARKLYETAAAIADSAGSLVDEELRARQGLMGLYKASGNWEKALEEAEHVIELSARLTSRECMQRVDEERMKTSAMLGERDQAVETLLAERVRSEAELAMAEARADRWMWMAAGLGILFLISLFIVLYLIGRSNRRSRAELVLLRSEVATLKEQRPAEQVRVTPEVAGPQPGPVVLEPLTPGPSTTPVAAMDPLVMAMFQKTAPERLATLRAARARSDHAKVVRVVHTLKPQLAAIDPGRLGPICASITEPQAADDRVRWNAELDSLEQAIEELLG